MRKYIKNKLIDLLELSKKNNGAILEVFRKRDSETLIKVLSTSQDIAIRIGETIEKYHKVNVKTVSLLEEYCELLWKISQCCDEQQIIDYLECIEQITKDIFTSIQYDISETKEIVFLPYKACMWDSFESVWQAASKDDNCDVYVIPIPYFEKNADGSLGEMHYEGMQYPDYVPVIDYRKYDIETRKPDVIYIHNPYDDNNAITTVHPIFYASRICNFTENLVYIPYFVRSEGVSQDLRVLPGTIYAHKVIVSSEIDKKNYIEGFETWLLNKEASGDYELYMPKWREKFLVLGTPKFDKARSTNREKEKLPQDWISKIYKSIVTEGSHI